jgi:hypothetical protein
MTLKCVVAALIGIAPALLSVGALAEFQCAPDGAEPALPEKDRFFARETAVWSMITKGRPTEGDGRCPDVMVPGYEGFPTKRCSYADTDAGQGLFPALRAEVIVLNPSSRQLAAWSIHACRANGAQDSAMQKCLQNLRDHVVASNGAQFPIVGSVVESYCNSSSHYGDCAKTATQWRRPRNTWFRDGVAVDYNAFGVHWDEKTYSQDTFDAVLDVSRSDASLNCTYEAARIAGADRSQWNEWRAHNGKPGVPDVKPCEAGDGKWRLVASEVHKAACRGASNELFDAVVFASPHWTVP